MQFPEPIRLGENTTRWRLSDLERFEAAAAGEPVPRRRDPADERYLSVRQVADRLGSSIPSIWRWTAEARQSARHEAEQTK